MKILMIRNISIDVDKTRLNEVWPMYLQCHDAFRVDSIQDIADDVVNVVLDSGDVLLEVPKNSFTLKKYESS